MTESKQSPAVDEGNPSDLAARVDAIEVIQVHGRYSRQPQLFDNLKLEFRPVTALGTLDGVSVQALVQFAARLRALGDSEEVVMEIEAVYVVQYTLKPGDVPSAADVDAFARYNGAFNAFSYWRAFFESSLFQAGLPRMKLPPFVPGKHAAHPMPKSALESPEASMG